MEAQFISPTVEILYKLETRGLCYFSSAKGDCKFSSPLNGYIQLYNSFPDTLERKIFFQKDRINFLVFYGQ